MGLSEPRKRLKIAHDPNNVSWSQSTDSYGHRLMRSQGWTAGEGLGAKDTKRVRSSDSGRITVTYKDDMLGLGAKLKSMDVEHSRAGLDAFQGLLGRLNGKSDAELKKEEQKVEDRKLAMWAQGKWGGMTFVPGGLLVQGDPFKMKDEAEEATTPNPDSSQPASDSEEAVQKAKRKEEKRGKKAENKQQLTTKNGASEKRSRKEERGRKRALENQVDGADGQNSPDGKGEAKIDDLGRPDITGDAFAKKKRREKLKHAESPAVVEVAFQKQPVITPVPLPPRNGRSILRSKNIQAKKMAFGDAKMLDEIFMRRS